MVITVVMVLTVVMVTARVVMLIVRVVMVIVHDMIKVMVNCRDSDKEYVYDNFVLTKFHSILSIKSSIINHIHTTSNHITRSKCWTIWLPRA